MKNEERLPPKQKWISKILRWGKDHPGISKNLPKVAKKDWVLKIEGEVETPLEFNWESFTALPNSISVSDFHCVETWSVKDQKWEGVIFIDLLKVVKPKPNVKYVFFECYDNYTTSLPIRELMNEDIILAFRLNDEELPQDYGGPVRLIVPHKYGYKSAMWVNRIEFRVSDKPGYWESGIYSNSADIWKDDRYRLF